MQRKPLVVIEHLEDHASRWLLAEYEHALSIAGERLVVTNARTYCNTISQIVGSERCFQESILDLKGVLYSRPERVIILDPRAEQPLTPRSVSGADAVVVGGILGDHPPRGRTWELLTKRALAEGMRAANLGPLQLSIDGAVYVATKIIEGRSLRDIKLVEKPAIEIDLGDGLAREVELPFAYPLVKGKPLISRRVLELLRAGLGYEEYKLAREG